MKESLYSRGIRPGSRNGATGDPVGGLGEREAPGGLGESVGDTAKAGGTGVANGVGGGTVGTRVGGRNRATSPIRWRHASIAYQTRNPAPAIARPMKTREMSASSPTPPIPS